MLSALDYAIILMYFVFIGGLGWFFRHTGRDSSDYFRGGGRVPWWLVGSSVFMTAFSAWTFTGAAGLAYDAGIVALTIFWANALGLVAAAIWFGPWFRQTRAVTATEAIRQRLGFSNQQLLLWLSMPLSVIRAAVWLYGLAIFLSPVFEMDTTVVILATGIVVTLMAAFGGSWAAITGDLMQALLLMPITLLAAWFACEEVGGMGPLISGLPPDHLELLGSALHGYGALWLAALILEKLLFTNNLGAAGRFLSVRSSAEARKAAWLAAILFSVGTLVWFVPPLAARVLQLDLAAQFPHIAKPSETAYAAIALLTLPPGLLGFLVTGILAATMSSMDTGLNANAGTFVRGVYLPLVRPGAGERELVVVGRSATLVMGTLIILLALKYTTWRDLGVFTLMFNLSAMLLVPTVVPSFWCLFTRRSPDWAVWSTMAIGFCVSVVLGWMPRQESVAAWLGHAGLSGTAAWVRTHEYAVILITNCLVCSAWFWATTWLGRTVSTRRQSEVEAFFKSMHEPVHAGPVRDEGRLSLGIARICFCYGGFIALTACIPNTARGHGGLALCAVFFVVVGFLLRRWTRAFSSPTSGAACRDTPS